MKRKSLIKWPVRTFIFAAIVSGLFSLNASGQMAAIAAIDEPAERAGGAAAGAVGSAGRVGVAGGRQTTRGRSSSTRQRASNSKAPNKTATAAQPRKAPAKYDGFIVGDKYTFLNFEVVSAEKPYHTRAAKANGAKGLVQVEILIETDGSVIDAKGRTGNKELWPEAERAALASKFNRPTFGGKASRAIGFLVYRFGPAED